MNRIILIGNGFDLAHGLKTSYIDFMDDYWSNVINKLKETGVYHVFENDEIMLKNPTKHYSEKTYNCLKQEIINTNNNANNDISILKFKNIFFSIINEKLNLENWVDIENEYYNELKKILNNNFKKYDTIQDLNLDFENIKILLEEYLDKLEKKDNENIRIKRKIYSKMNLKDFSILGINNLSEKIFEEFKLLKSGKDIKPQFFDNKDIYFRELFDKINNINDLKEFLKKDQYSYCFNAIPSNTLLLNFNYTTTHLHYDYQSSINSNDFKTKCTDIHIHGKLKDQNNQIIFGYGDELDEDYLKIEKLNQNEYLENIKSIKYSETDNYKRFLEFIESDTYQVCIMGHSCGTSDRTLLNTLFEHDNCVSIKPYFHAKKDGTDNYSKLIRNISRNFNDKRKMRERVVNRTYCEPLS
jgi:hypothetical protein